MKQQNVFNSRFKNANFLLFWFNDESDTFLFDELIEKLANEFEDFAFLYFYLFILFIVSFIIIRFIIFIFV